MSRRAEGRGQDLGQLGLAHAGLALEEQRTAQLEAPGRPRSSATGRRCSRGCGTPRSGPRSSACPRAGRNGRSWPRTLHGRRSSRGRTPRHPLDLDDDPTGTARLHRVAHRTVLDPQVTIAGSSSPRHPGDPGTPPIGDRASGRRPARPSSDSLSTTTSRPSSRTPLGGPHRDERGDAGLRRAAASPATAPCLRHRPRRSRSRSSARRGPSWTRSHRTAAPDALRRFLTPSGLLASRPVRRGRGRRAGTGSAGTGSGSRRARAWRPSSPRPARR